MKKFFGKIKDVLDPLAERQRTIYEIRDFKSMSLVGIIICFLAMILGFFNLHINLVSSRIVLGASFINNFAEFCVIVSLIFLIVGTVSTINYNFLFMEAAFLLPLFGEIIYLLYCLIAGHIGEYFSERWIYLVTYLLMALCYLGSTFKLYNVKIGKFIMAGIALLSILLAILSIVLHFAPYYTEAMADVKVGQVTTNELCGFIYITEMLENIALVLAFLAISLTIFDYSEEDRGDITVVKLKEEKEEF